MARFQHDLTNFQDFFSFQLKLFKYVGFRVDDIQLKYHRINKMYLYLCVVFLIFYDFCIFMYILMLDGKIEDKLSALFTFTSTLEVLMKIVSVHRSSKKIQKLLEDLREIADFEWTPKDDWVKEANMILCYGKFAISSAGLFFLVTVLVTFGKSLADLRWEAVYVNKLWYPLDEQNPIFFVPVCLFHMIHATIYMIYFTASDITILMVMIHINRQFDLIAGKMSSIKNSEEVKLLVERHCSTTKILDELNDVFGLSLLFQLIFSSIYVCISQFIVVSSEDVNAKFRFLVVETNLLLRLYLFCRIGDATTKKV